MNATEAEAAGLHVNAVAETRQTVQPRNAINTRNAINARNAILHRMTEMPSACSDHAGLASHRPRA